MTNSNYYLQRMQLNFLMIVILNLRTRHYNNSASAILFVNGFCPRTTEIIHPLRFPHRGQASSSPSFLIRQVGRPQQHQLLFNIRPQSDTTTTSTSLAYVKATTKITEEEDLLVDPASLETSTSSTNSTEISREKNNAEKEQSPLMDPMAFFEVDDADSSNGAFITKKSETTATVRKNDYDDDDQYRRGLLTIGFITFLFSTNSPILHCAFTDENAPPVLLVNAAVSVVALVGLLLGGDTLEKNSSYKSAPLGSNEIAVQTLQEDQKIKNKEALCFSLLAPQTIGGLELGMWKFLGTTSNLFGLAYTTAGHGALLIQLTTLIVPISRAIVYKETIPTRLKLSIVLALGGVICFANDPTGTPSLLGDGLCVLAAICYSAYDLRLYEYGKTINAKPLITGKIATQASLSVILFALSGFFYSGSFSWQQETIGLESIFVSSAMSSPIIVGAILWSGVVVNAVAPFLQVSGQQIVGPTKCQTIYASQPLWAAILSYVFLGETLGIDGLVGGTAFLFALTLAATTSTETAGVEKALCSNDRDRNNVEPTKAS